MGYLISQTTNGTKVTFETDPLNSGGEKIVFFTHDHRHVVAFFYGHLPDRPERVRRLENIIGPYNPTLSGAHADYWKRHFCWPIGIIDADPSIPPDFIRRHNLLTPVLGVVTPAYRSNFFFKDRTGETREKKGKWYTSPKARQLLPDQEKGNFLGYLQVCTIIARAIRRMHNAGLAHSDLSHNNVLIDPKNGDACILDIDSLVVPGVAPPSVLGTPGYIAPEVVAGKALPSIETDYHALAVLIYETLLLRHPLRGPKVRSTRSAEEDEKFSMGRDALFIEHPFDQSNLPKPPPAMPVSRLGPHLERLFYKSFIEGLHEPSRRATAGEWEKALSRTFDVLHPSPAKNQWFVLEPGMPMRCPYTGKPIDSPVPYAECLGHHPVEGFIKEDHRLTIWNGFPLHRWHLFTNVSTMDADRSRKAFFSFHQGRWFLMNESGEEMKVHEGPLIPHGQALEITNGLKIELSLQPHARMLHFKSMAPSGAANGTESVIGGHVIPSLSRMNALETASGAYIRENF